MNRPAKAGSTKQEKVMFTIKYRSYQPAAAQPADGSNIFYEETESLNGPFEFISQEWVDGYLVVYAHRAGGDLGMTYGPVKGGEAAGGKPTPRPRLWVMNDHGATVAKYDL